MDKDYLIKKWLEDELTPAELKNFEALEDFDMHIKILEGAKYFKASDVSEAADMNTFYERLGNNKVSKNKNSTWYTPFLRIAALIVVLLGIGSLFFVNNNSSINSSIGEKISVTLPDASEVVLNSKSEIVFNKRNWEDKRELTLEGEAFFKVTKGSTFDVITSTGRVSVLGTQFNVKNRKGYFEVQCFEGLVSVHYDEREIKISAGKTFKILDQLATSSITTEVAPQWINNISSFKSVPFYEVLKEFERQYDVVFSLQNIDTSRIFTGGFVHTNLEDGLKSITLPLDLEYKIDSKKYIILYNKKQ